jgi:hypothetical protein
MHCAHVEVVLLRRDVRGCCQSNALGPRELEALVKCVYPSVSQPELRHFKASLTPSPSMPQLQTVRTTPVAFVEQCSHAAEMLTARGHRAAGHG